MEISLLFVVFVLGTFTLVYLAMSRASRRRQRRSEPVTIHFGPLATGDSPPSWTSGPFTVATVATKQTVATAMAVAEGVAKPLSYGEREAYATSPSDSLDPVLDTKEKNPATPRRHKSRARTQGEQVVTRRFYNDSRERPDWIAWDDRVVTPTQIQYFHEGTLVLARVRCPAITADKHRCERAVGIGYPTCNVHRNTETVEATG